MDEALPILYSFRRCPYAIRARLAISASQARCQLREVILRDKPAEMIEVSPKATVPVLVEADGRVIDQSLDIMLNVLMKNDPQGWLGADSQSLKQMLQLIELTETKFKPRLDRYKYSTRYEDCERKVEREAAGVFLITLDNMLFERPYLFASKTLLADIAIAPFVRQFAQSDRAWFNRQGWDKLSSWLRRFEQSDLFLSVMNKYPAWRHGDRVEVFPCNHDPV